MNLSGFIKDTLNPIACLTLTAVSLYNIYESRDARKKNEDLQAALLQKQIGSFESQGEIRKARNYNSLGYSLGHTEFTGHDANYHEIS